MTEEKPKAGQDAERTQRDVLKEKDEVLEKDDRGLQLWGEGAMGVEGQHGEASEGTAARSARITEAQLRKEREREE